MEKLEPLFAVIDTNILVSALLSSTSGPNPFIILESIYNGKVKPLYDSKILEEYENVLSRQKFHFSPSQIKLVLQSIIEFGREINERVDIIGENFPDPKDIMFYEIRMAMDDSYLVTGNIRHFPIKPFVVTPLQMVEILREKGLI